MTCDNCSAATLCLPMGLETEHLSRLNTLVDEHLKIKKGDVFIHPGDPFKYFYAVKEGALKSYVLDYEGREQIWGIYLIGELFGFEGVDSFLLPYYVQALEDTVICAIPYDLLMQFIQEVPTLQRQVLKLMSQRFVMDLGLPRNNSSLQRLASFLLTLSSRFQRQGLSATDLSLPLSRQEIANYLGLTLETVSRLFSRFKRDNILRVDGKQITIMSLRELQKLAAK